jgi:alpha-methylacyl-CoA racemase
VSITSNRPGDGLLDGVVVLDLSTVGPAARASRVLADYGAAVTKVGPVPSVGTQPIVPPYFAYSGHRGMDRVEVDLKAPHGIEAFLALVAGADVVIESFRPGVLARLGLGYEVLAAVNEGIILCSTSGYGQEGPSAHRAGHDLDYLAAGGFLATTEARSDGGPPIPGATIADAAAGGLQAALAICAGLVGRARSGRGCHLDVSVADGVLWLMSLAIDEHLALGTAPGPGHDLLTGRFACYQTYETEDGGWVAVGAIEHKFWANLCRLLGLEQWVDLQMDPARQVEIKASLATAFATDTRDAWIERLADADTCVAPVLSVAELPTSELVGARGLVVEARHPTHGTFLQLAPVLAGQRRPATTVVSPDLTVTSTDALLEAAGVAPSTIATWRTEGVVA